MATSQRVSRGYSCKVSFWHVCILLPLILYHSPRAFADRCMDDCMRECNSDGLRAGLNVGTGVGLDRKLASLAIGNVSGRVCARIAVPKLQTAARTVIGLRCDKNWTAASLERRAAGPTTVVVTIPVCSNAPPVEFGIARVSVLFAVGFAVRAEKSAPPKAVARPRAAESQRARVIFSVAIPRTSQGDPGQRVIVKATLRNLLKIRKEEEALSQVRGTIRVLVAFATVMRCSFVRLFTTWRLATATCASVREIDLRRGGAVSNADIESLQ
jgi:hypothetical protein